MSGTVPISDQRSYIKIETLRGKNPTEIHGALGEVCGEFTVDRSTVSRWGNRFSVVCESIDNDPRPTHERSVKLVTVTVEEDHRATREELSRTKGAKNLAGKFTRTDLSCSWLGFSFSMTMLVRTSRML